MTTENTKTNAKSPLGRALATVGGLTLLSRVAGFGRDMMTSHILGAGPVADAFFVALKLPNFFRSITAEGAFSISFVPLYTEKKVKEGQEAATSFAAAALSFMIAVLIPFSIIMMIAMPWVIALLAPGFSNDPYKFELAIEMARLSFPYLLLVSIAALMGGILNAHNKFGPYAAAPVLFNLCLMASVLFDSFTKTDGHAMAIGMSISGALQGLFVWWFIHKMGLRLRLTFPRLTPDLRQLFKMMGPGILVAGVFQVNLFVNLTIASLLANGAISYLYYADRLYQLPFGVIGIAVGTALLPLFTQALARDDRDEARDLYNRSIEYMLILCLPCAFGLLLAADPIVRAMFLHGKFTETDAYHTSFVLMSYALGLPAYVISRVYNAVFYAHKDTWSPVKISMLTATLNTIFSLILAWPLGAMGIALSTSIVGWLQIYLLNRALDKRDLDLPFDDRLIRAFPKICICTGLMALTIAMMRYGLHDALHGSFFPRIFALVALIAAACIVYAASIFMTRLVPASDLKRFFTRKGRPIKNDHPEPPTQ